MAPIPNYNHNKINKFFIFYPEQFVTPLEAAIQKFKPLISDRTIFT